MTRIRVQTLWLLLLPLLLLAAGCGVQPAAAPERPVSTTIATRVATAAPIRSFAVPTATPVPPPTAIPMPSGPEPTGLGPLEVPVRVRIPRIGVNAPIETVGIEADGTMGTPKDFADVGWYGYGPMPGQVGASVIAGHVDSVHGPAVFWSLRDLRPGDRIEVDLLGGVTRRFVVDGSGSYQSDAAPLSAIFSWSGPPRLVVITCGGVFDRARHAYDHRLIVYAHLDTSSAQTTSAIPPPSGPARSGTRMPSLAVADGATDPLPDPMASAAGGVRPGCGSPARSCQ